MRYFYWFGLIAIVFAAIFLAPNTYYLYIIGTIAITTLVGVGLNVLTGLSGQVSLGHAGFFAIGAYAASLTMTKLQGSFWLATGIAVVVTTVVGIALAAPALRVNGPYLAMITVAFGIIIERVSVEWVDLTGGFGGIFNIPKPKLFNLQPALRDVVLLAWIAAILALFAFAALKRHAWGRAWQAVRDDEIAATAIGLNVLKIRSIAFAVSAAFTGLGGVFFASIVGFISPDSFTFHRSILFLLVVILGGLGTIAGPLVGAIALVLLPELLHDFAEYQLLVFGVLLLLTLWLTPEGIANFFIRRFHNNAPVYPPEIDLEDLPALLVKNKNDLPLIVENMGICFGGIKALDNVNLVARSRKITSVIGPNGAGKTTLLNLLTGFYRSVSGTVHLGELNLTNKNTLDLVGAGLSRTFQTTRLFNSLSVLDNLKVAYAGDKLGNIFTALLSKNKQKSSLEKKLMGLLAFVGYRGDIYTRADRLSFGDRRLVEIARALATSPQVLLLDEPAAGLGQQERDGLAKLLRRLADAGVKVIFIEHDINLVMKISDRVVVLDRGKVICSEIPANVQNNSEVLAAYLGVSDRNVSRPPTVSTPPILSVENLAAGYGQLQVLQQVSLEVRQGGLIAVIGANGAGKTTLLKSIARLLPVRSGRVLFRDRNLNKLSPQQLASKGIVLIPEGRQVFTQLTVMDNLRLGAFSRRDSRIKIDIDAMFDRFPILGKLKNRKAGLLSGGEQQMLAIARGLMAKPQILLLDEPSLGLAPQLVVSIYETLRSWCDEGISILLVDQMAQLTFSVANRVYVLETGQIVKAGTPHELSKEPAITNAYFGNLS
jgi:ABC-type branched-subunit amino acid transport system ATPase component/ABC-type branched-subunit amino acid transport system permease subunit